MIHYTYTGYDAGQTWCGSKRNDPDKYIHGMYGPPETDNVCPNCAAIRAAFDDPNTTDEQLDEIQAANWQIQSS